MIEIRIKVLGGTHINVAAKKATELARKLNCIVSFDFNGHELFASKKKSVKKLIAEYYFNKK